VITYRAEEVTLLLGFTSEEACIEKGKKRKKKPQALKLSHLWNMGDSDPKAVSMVSEGN